MKTNTKIAVSLAALAIVGGVAFAGSSWAERGFGHRGMGMGMMGVGMQMMQDVDLDADGAISQDEINTAINTRMGEFDLDKNNALTLDEFKALWAEITEPAAVRAFQFLDPNGDASVEKAELDEHFGTAVARFDRNDDGVLSPDDRPRHRGRWHGQDRGERGDDNR